MGARWKSEPATRVAASGGSGRGGKKGPSFLWVSHIRPYFKFMPFGTPFTLRFFVWSFPGRGEDRVPFVFAPLLLSLTRWSRAPRARPGRRLVIVK